MTPSAPAKASCPSQNQDLTPVMQDIRDRSSEAFSQGQTEKVHQACQDLEAFQNCFAEPLRNQDYMTAEGDERSLFHDISWTQMICQIQDDIDLLHHQVETDTPTQVTDRSSFLAAKVFVEEPFGEYKISRFFQERVTLQNSNIDKRYLATIFAKASEIYQSGDYGQSIDVDFLKDTLNLPPDIDLIFDGKETDHVNEKQCGLYQLSEPYKKYPATPLTACSEVELTSRLLSPSSKESPALHVGIDALGIGLMIFSGIQMGQAFAAQSRFNQAQQIPELQNSYEQANRHFQIGLGATFAGGSLLLGHRIERKLKSSK